MFPLDMIKSQVARNGGKPTGCETCNFVNTSQRLNSRHFMFSIKHLNFYCAEHQSKNHRKTCPFRRAAQSTPADTGLVLTGVW